MTANAVVWTCFSGFAARRREQPMPTAANEATDSLGRTCLDVHLGIKVSYSKRQLSIRSRFSLEEFVFARHGVAVICHLESRAIQSAMYLRDLLNSVPPFL